MTFVAAHLNAGVMLVLTVCTRYVAYGLPLPPPPGVSVPARTSGLRSRVKVEVDVLGSPSLIRLVSVDVINNSTINRQKATSSETADSAFRAQELCESRRGHPGFVLDSRP